METINIKFDEEQLEDIVKKVTEELKKRKKLTFMSFQIQSRKRKRKSAGDYKWRKK
ncbi:putative HNH endonuclease [Lactococcus phage ASCC191]|uniref:Putative HNH endonuclease n=1 Tax=Lactococcus phage ASCC191 TaxID=2892347 RepID=H9ED46_9CAUD|nr:putative HNH endonuclease [Lactococcus phage ASCC191]AFE86780.1 putative HNH endonuclease [Lactococcus phage ASCC191]